MANADKRARNLELYAKLVATNPLVERKGDTMPYTSVNGHMFSLFTKEDQMTLRLPPDELEALQQEAWERLNDKSFTDAKKAMRANATAAVA